MSSSRDDNWLAGVEAILRSKTRDLRKLADLAGLNPATMYIGTPMDGADLRGQDLRGMKFTHLDRAKVRVDARTRFDEEEPADLVASRGLIAFLDEEMEAACLARPEKLPFAFAPYGPDRIDQFLAACDLFDGPKLIVDKLTPDARPSERLLAVSKQLHGAIVLLLAPARPSVLEEGARVARDAISGPTVLLAQPIGVAGPRRDPSLSPVLRDVLGLALSNWGDFSESAVMRGASVFVTARRDTGGDIESAWFNLYSKVLKLGLFPSDADRVEVDAGWRRATGAAELLLPRSRAMAVNVGGRWPNLDAGLLVSARSDQPTTAGFDYEQVVRRLLEHNGWKVTDTPTPKGAFSRESDFSAEARFGLDIEVRLPRRRAPTALFDLPPDLKIGFADGLVVCESAEPGPILETLHRDGRLMVSLQDLRWLDAEAVSLWTVVTHQARRMLRGLGGRARSLYFAALARSAIYANRVNAPDHQAFIERLAPVESWAVDLKAYGEDHVVFEISMIYQLGAPNEIADTFFLSVDPGGPSIHAMTSLP